ncbi:uncharacterized protein MONOS_2817 [Monocercomonoides exilis]|uniref:uncharacterized protein n=1 Tax=Monocercomonoides exilis TaxID=2049356 RepID=UPI00355950FB|nr:hypothetical protein MONOS_2817 [Monocercomonoides exilis]|eukprot:MONOS_2817.1-p1 / transcript=MONOS_2817.1 / gene=MONOS_2817 / organism=Monocercomonoides_exilis_PA203 / gene_product=unspecified product / transcript_product=unspecified product / location=Mono_scaffold00060:110404-111083(-) / protein_length=90 / sequence_SO=supercontig / SO=protein_coding / is_pseudo=false
MSLSLKMLGEGAGEEGGGDGRRDREETSGVQHAAAEDPGRRADVKSYERTGGAAAGEEQDGEGNEDADGTVENAGEDDKIAVGAIQGSD